MFFIKHFGFYITFQFYDRKKEHFLNENYIKNLKQKTGEYKNAFQFSSNRATEIPNTTIESHTKQEEYGIIFPRTTTYTILYIWDKKTIHMQCD